MKRQNIAYLCVGNLNVHNIKPGDKVKFKAGETKYFVNGQLHKYSKVVTGIVTELGNRWFKVLVEYPKGRYSTCLDFTSDYKIVGR